MLRACMRKEDGENEESKICASTDSAGAQRNVTRSGTLICLRLRSRGYHMASRGCSYRGSLLKWCSPREPRSEAELATNQWRGGCGCTYPCEGMSYGGLGYHNGYAVRRGSSCVPPSVDRTGRESVILTI